MQNLVLKSLAALGSCVQRSPACAGNQTVSNARGVVAGRDAWAPRHGLPEPKRKTAENRGDISYKQILWPVHDSPNTPRCDAGRAVR